MKKKKIRIPIIVMLIFGLIVIVVIVAFLLVGDAFMYQPSARRVTLDWEDCGPTPGSGEQYKPQGATFANDRLILANHWHDTNSRVYEIDPAAMNILRWFDMPSEAVHTGGLAWDGEYLWASDYKSYLIYKIDLEASFEQQRALVLDSFSTDLRGLSACCYLEYENHPALAISDWRNSRRTYIVDHLKICAGTPFEEAVLLSYRNESFSQGLVWIDGYLYESENKFNGAVINKLDLALLAQTGSARRSTVAQIIAPGPGVEDLAWDGRNLWTSDEKKYRIYRATLRVD